jgi:hypothetical protein
MHPREVPPISDIVRRGGAQQTRAAESAAFRY